jgi:hypothetical protein
MYKENKKSMKKGYALLEMKGESIGSLKNFKQKVTYNMLIQEKTLQINI